MTLSPEQTRFELELSARAAELGLDLSAEQSKQLLSYLDLLNRWNRVYNLTAIHDARQAFTHHLLDCLAIIPALHRTLGHHPNIHLAQPLRLLDAGSGGGLPGIPLAVTHPNWSFTLVDTVQKKCAFLQQASVELKLRHVQVHHARLENLKLPPQHLIVSRAFASLRDFVHLTRHLLAPDGLWIAMKGKLPHDELDALPEGVICLETIALTVPSLPEERHLIILGQR